ncbi:MAG TPA: SulP family inorganic anion transporter [Stenomitos sp.]
MHASSTVSPTVKERPQWLGDVMGGITSAIVALPLALAFAVASGVDPKAGLYTAIVAGIVGSLFGGSAVQVTGPTGAMAVVLAGIVAQYGFGQVMIAGLMAGLIQIGLGLGRLGRLISYLPFPVITGFTNGIGVLIFAGQLGNMLGLASQTPKGVLHHQVYWQLSHLTLANPATVAITLVTVVTIVLWGKFNQVIPGSLVALVIATLGSVFLGLDVPRIGAIPQGLPLPAIPTFDLDSLGGLIRPALALAALGSIESLLSATVADRMTGGKKHDPDRELIGQGLANVAVPFFGGIPATGAIARTAVNIRSGAKTRLSGVLHGLVIALVVIALGSLAASIPMAALAGILMVTSFRMIEWEQVKLLAYSTKSDMTVMLLTWGVTVAFDLVLAVEVGLMAAAFLFIRRMSDVHLVTHPEVPLAIGVPPEVANEIGVYDVDRPLFFGDAHRFADMVLSDPNRKAVIIDMSTTTTMDVTAALCFEDLVRELRKRGVKVGLVHLTPEVQELMSRLGVIGRIGRQHLFERPEEAVDVLWHELYPGEKAVS